MDAVRIWIDELAADDLPEPYRQIAQLVGVQNTVRLADSFGGTHLYLPKVESALRALRDRKIREEFNGYNHKELAKKYVLTEKWVREIVSSLEVRDPNQLDLFSVIAQDGSQSTN